MKINLRHILTFGLLILLCVTMANAQTAPTAAQEKESEESPQVAAANNNFANAQVISGSSTNAVGNTIDATQESGEPLHAGQEGNRSVWYSWTAPSSGSVTFITTNINFNTLLAVYTGASVNNLTPIASNDDDIITGTQNGSSRVTFGALAGKTYRIAVAGHYSLSGNFTILLQLSNQSFNDLFAAAHDISSMSQSVTGTNLGALKEPGEPAHYGNIGGKSIWYKWTAPNAGVRSYTFSTRGSTRTQDPTVSANTVMAVYTGNSVSALTQVAANDFFIDETSQVTFVATPNSTYYIAVDGYNPGPGAQIFNLILSWDVTKANKAADFDADGKSDITVFRPSNGNFYQINSSNNSDAVTHWGASGDKPVLGDYDHDEKTDYAVFRPSEGNWYVLNSSNNTFVAQHWGTMGDIPVQSNYRGLGTIIGVFRPSTGVWYIQSLDPIYFGLNGDIPVAGDYNGNGTSEVAVFRQSNATWYVRNTNDSLSATQIGVAGDVPVPADYDRDGSVDPAVFRPSTGAWTYYSKLYGLFGGQQWGVAGDIPVAGDFDGDSYADYTVFRPSDGTWYSLETFEFEPKYVQFGLGSDIPATSAYQIP